MAKSQHKKAPECNSPHLHTSKNSQEKACRKKNRQLESTNHGNLITQKNRSKDVIPRRPPKIWGRERNVGHEKRRNL